MKKVVFVFVLCVFTVSTIYSQTTKQELIKELFHLMQKDSVIDRTFATMMPALLQMTQRKDSILTDAERNLLNSKLQKAKDLSAKLQTEEMALYDKYFSQNEILDLVAFYKTKSGRRLMELTPKIQTELNLIVQQKYMQDIVRIVQSMKESGK